MARPAAPVAGAGAGPPAAPFWALAALVALLPLPFGGNRLWAWSLMAGLVGLLFLGWAVLVLRRPDAVRIPWRRHAPATAAWLLAIAWFALQASGWTPAGWDHPLWAAAGEALGRPDLGGAISLDPAASLDGTMRLLAYGGIFWLALHLCRSRARARQALWVVVAAGTAYAAYGLAVQFSGANTILWFDKWAYGDVVTATFVNRNNYATYDGLAILAALCLLTRQADDAAAMGVGSRTGWLYILDHVGVQVYLLLAALVILGSALLLTGSRGGIVSTALGILAFLGALALYKRRRLRRTLVFAGLVAAAATALVALSGNELTDRLGQASDDLAGRGRVWQLAREAIAERPMLGTGLGTFAEVYQQGRDARLPPHTAPFTRAHNGYLEMILEGGAVGAALVFAALGWLFLWCVYGALARRTDGPYPCLGIGAVALVATHALVDFSLQIPAVAATFAWLLAIGCAQSNRHQRQGG